MENRPYCDPLMIEDDGTTHKLERVPFDERALQEGWLQDLLERHPELLPIEDIEPGFAPLIPIGREVRTAAGAIDNLFVSPDGYITLVETKLWRNPEARRQVVAQIIDYAKQVSQWDFEQLDTHICASARQRSRPEPGLLEIVKASGFGAQLDEAQFVDRVTRNLRRGRLLLIVAGDGIRESVEEMADYLQQTPQLHFTLALVELLVYRLEPLEESLLVAPQVLARTREITRAVVRVEGSRIESVHVDIDTTTDMARARSRGLPLAEEDFFDLLSQNVSGDQLNLVERLKSDAEGLGAKVEFGEASLIVKLPDPTGSGELLSLLRVHKSGGLSGGWLDNKLRVLGLPREIAEEYFEQVASLFEDCTVTETPSRGNLMLSRAIRLSEVDERYDELMEVLAEMIERIRHASEVRS